MFRHRRLDQGTTGQFGAAAPAHHLGDQAEHAEALTEEQRVDAQHPHQGDLLEIQALGHHLGAQQDIVFLPAELAQHGFMGVLLPGGILIHAQDAGGGQQLVKLLLHPLGAESAVQKLAAAFRTAGGGRVHHMPAVVAH